MKIINSAQENILRGFPEVKDSENFYLAGGTALAHFYLRHRQSNDLDFFTPVEEIIDSFSHQLEKHLLSKGFKCERQRTFHSFVELVVSLNEETTIIHLALDSSFRFKPAQEFPEYPRLKIDSLEDIASNKLLALFGRATLRDFIDIYFLIQKEYFSKKQLIEAAFRKDPGFDLYWLGVAFERIHTFKPDSSDMLLLIEQVKLSELDKFFTEWLREIIQDIKK